MGSFFSFSHASGSKHPESFTHILKFSTEANYGAYVFIQHIPNLITLVMATDLDDFKWGIDKFMGH